MTRPIVTDPDKFDGEPFVEGTSITVAEVQAYWKQNGVYAAEIRRRFPELSESELGAAVTYAPPREPEFCFVAEWDGPPARRLWLTSLSTGWEFSYQDIVPDRGQPVEGGDYWEDSWDQILLYPEKYAAKDLVGAMNAAGPSLISILRGRS